MLIDSMIIKLTRGGAGIGPDYSLTIYGNGKVIYDGVENVKVKGIVESSIDDNKVISLLSEFKESGFFSLDDTYSIGDSITRPYTIVSISIPKENGEVTAKSVKYHHGDRNVPKELKTLEDKIDEIVGSNRWIDNLSEYEEFEPKKESKPSVKPPSHKKMPSGSTKKKPTKLIAVGVSFIVVIVMLLYAIESGILSLPSEEKELPDGSSIKYSTPEITNLTTASDIREYEDYDAEYVFNQGDTIYVYQEYNNITTKDDTKCDISIDITVSLNGKLYHSYSYNESNVKNFSKLQFTTDDLWLPGIYLVTIDLEDNISKKSTSAQTNFILFEKVPEITVLIPASEVRGYRDYDQTYFFDKGDKIWIYQEYTNITTIDNETCDIYINITVTITADNESVTLHFDEISKNKTGNFGQAWWFIPDESWPTGIYYDVTSNLRDNISTKSTSKKTFFIMSG